MKFIEKMTNLELEVRSYIIIFGITFLLVFLSGCKHTAEYGASYGNYGTGSGGEMLVPLIRWAF